MTTLPAWCRDLATLYESGASSQFILHGNVSDLFLVPGKPKPRLGTLMEYLAEVLLGRFDVVLRYDLGSGMRIERGGKTFQDWPSASTQVNSADPRAAIAHLTHYFRFAANLSAAQGRTLHIACVVKDAHLLAPSGPGSLGTDLGGIALQMRDWASDTQLSASMLATFLISESVNDLHPLLAKNPRAEAIKIPLPSASEIQDTLEWLRPHCSEAVPEGQELSRRLADGLLGASLAAVQSLVRRRHHEKQPLADADLAQLKKAMVERDCQGLIEFVAPERTLDDVAGMDAAKAWIRQDMALWKNGTLEAMPMGYLLCGPVGTGKTYLAECLAGEAGVPVVKLANFRDRWVGSTEGNLERIFRLLHALGRCVVFIDEADQALGQRNAGNGDSGLSGRVYAMIAKEMSDTRQRGRILWLLASSRPDLIEVDLKRPGRVDVKIPLFPAATAQEGWMLLRVLSKKRGVILPESMPQEHAEHWPQLLTAGAAEALAVKIARQVKGASLSPEEALKRCLVDYEPPVNEKIMRHQIRLAIAEATEKNFVPDIFRKMALEEE